MFCATTREYKTLYQPAVIDSKGPVDFHWQEQKAQRLMTTPAFCAGKTVRFAMCRLRGESPLTHLRRYGFACCNISNLRPAKA